MLAEIAAHFRGIIGTDPGPQSWIPFCDRVGANGVRLPAEWIVADFPELGELVPPEPIAKLTERRKRFAFTWSFFGSARNIALVRFGMGITIYIVVFAIMRVSSKYLPMKVAPMFAPFIVMIFVFTMISLQRLAQKTIFPLTGYMLFTSRNPEALLEIIRTPINARDVFLSHWLATMGGSQLRLFRGVCVSSRWKLVFQAAVAATAVGLATWRPDGGPYAQYAKAIKNVSTALGFMALVIGLLLFISQLFAGGIGSAIFQREMRGLDMARYRDMKFIEQLRHGWREACKGLAYAIPALMFVLPIIIMNITLVISCVLMTLWMRYRVLEFVIPVAFILPYLAIPPLKRPYQRFTRYAARRHFERFTARYDWLRKTQLERIERGEDLPFIVAYRR